MLRAEQRHQVHSRRVGKQIRCAASLRVKARVIGDQANVFIAQQRKLLRFEDVDTGLQTAGTPTFPCGGEGRSGKRHGQEPKGRAAKRACWPFRTAKQAKILHSTVPIILWNPAFALALFA